MISQLKYRVIGGLVVVALLLIFAPMFFHKSTEYRQLAAKPAPDLPKITMSTKPTQPANQSLPKVAAKKLPPLKAYTVQVASFKKQKNADELVNKLIKAHFKAYALSKDKSHLMQVFVGPMTSQENAKQVLAQVKKETGLHGLVRDYDPQQV